MGLGGMFDFNRSMLQMIREVILRIQCFSHIDPDRLQIGASFTRTSGRRGLLAYVVPLKFRHGTPIERRIRANKIYHWAMLPRYEEGREILYIIYFLLPRFFNLSFQGKLETVIHELYHISPQFDGSLRVFAGRSRLHGNHRDYDRRVGELTMELLKDRRNLEDCHFLHFNSRQLGIRYDRIQAHHPIEPRPKLLRVEMIRPEMGLREAYPTL